MQESFGMQLSTLGPTLWIAWLAALAMIFDLVFPKRDRSLRIFVAASLFIEFFIALGRTGTNSTAFYGLIGQSGYTYYFDLLFIAIAFFTVILSGPYFERTGLKTPETIALMLFATCGAMLMIDANDLIILFLGLELMSICLYVMAGMLRDRPKSNEGALKYFLLGAFSTGFFLYGIALLYGATGSTNYGTIASASVQISGTTGTLYWAGVGLLFIGFFFKTATVPFHFWSPDAYEGAPTPITGFFSVGPKAAAFGALVKVLIVALPTAGLTSADIISVLAMLTMAVGNFVALRQTSVKRMLAYSSIAHAGYLLVALAAANEDGSSALLLYLAAYSATNLGAFTIAYLINRKVEGQYTFDDYNGLSQKHPFLAAIMTLFMVSLAGIPPTGGFLGKYYIFFAAIRSGRLTLGIVMALLSAVSVFYYLRIVVHMYMKPAADPYEPVKPGYLVQSGLLICGLVILAIGLFPAGWLTWIHDGIHSLVM